MKILFVISEVDSFTKTGGLADVGKALPLALKAQGHDVRIVKPYYQQMRGDHSAATELTHTELHSGQQHYPFRVMGLALGEVPVYAVDYPPYFDRSGLYTDGYEAYADNGQRFAFFALASLQVAKALDFQPDVLHCHDWHTALCPFFLNQDHSGFFSQTRSVLTIHNGAFQGTFPVRETQILRSFNALSNEMDQGGYLNFLRIGINNADKITAVSPNYAQELQSPLGSHHLYDAFSQRQGDIRGILNGCDYADWDPATDTLLPANYSSADLSGKSACKAALQQEMALPVAADVPVIGMVCRLTDQKGFGFILPILEQLLMHNLQLAIVGTGDPAIVEQLQQTAQYHGQKFAFRHAFSNHLAHLLEAGSDFFLMPSLFEPCGLNQMYSLAYGSLPIVRAVGGLKDTVVDLEQNPAAATGFVFSNPQPQDLLNCIRRALLCYREYPQTYAAMRERGMHTRFTWEAAAQDYQQLYQGMLA